MSYEYEDFFYCHINTSDILQMKQWPWIHKALDIDFHVGHPHFIIHPCDTTVVICYLIWPCDIAVHITYLISHSTSLSSHTVN